jgi:creatinine amidohydrolase
LVLALAAPATMLAQGSKAEKEVGAILEELRQMPLKAGEYAIQTTEKYYTDDMVRIPGYGTLYTKADMIAGFKKAQTKADAFEFSDVKIRIHGNIAVVTGIESGKGRSGPAGVPWSDSLRFTRVLMKRDGMWKVVVYQDTKIPAPATRLAQSKPANDVDFGMMTWPEVKAALAGGKTTALIYNGGTEQRGPQCVNGGHNLMAQATVIAIARRLGNAIAAPVLPFSPNRASADLPGTIGLTPELFAAVNERVAEQLITTGFKNIVFMVDHGGGLKQLGEMAKRLDAKYSPQGVRVVFADEVYSKRQEDFDKWLEANGYPLSTHAGIPDTSEMLYLGGDQGWVRKELIPTAVGDPVLKPGEKRDPNVPLVSNGIDGDARRSSAELGKRVFDMKIDYAVDQINRLLNGSGTSARQ